MYRDNFFLKDDMNIVISCYDKFETLDINLQLLRKGGVRNKIFVYVAKPKLNLQSCAEYIIEKVFNRYDYDRGKNLSVYDCFQRCLCDERKKYTMFLYEDIWVVNTQILDLCLFEMERNGYDGINYYTVEHGRKVFNTSFYVIKTELLDRLLSKDEKDPIVDNASWWEFRFYGLYKDLDWLMPYGGVCFDQYNYKFFLGISHVHTTEQKLNIIRSWKKYNEQNIKFNEEKLKEEKMVLGRNDNSFIFVKDTSLISTFNKIPFPTEKEIGD